MIEKLRNFWTRLQYGTMFDAFQYRLSRIGVEISPYYFVREGIFDDNQPTFSHECEDFSFKFLGLDDIEQIVETKAWGETEEGVRSRFENGQKCYGAKYKDQLAAFMWINLEEFTHRGFSFPLKDDEAYLFGMYTMKPFRGKGLAPILRYKCYEVLKEMGRDKCCSYTDYFNSPAKKFKKKLNAKPEHVGLYICLFNTFHWNWLKHKVELSKF